MIERTELFQGLSAATVEALQQRMTKRQLAKGELLFNLGDPPDYMYFVEAGRVRIWTVSAAGAEVTLNVLGQGSIFGEIAFLDGSERTAGASALDRSVLQLISRPAFDAALDNDPQLARNVIGFLCERLRWVSHRMEDAALRSAPERLARIIVHLSEDYGRDSEDGLRLSLNLTQAELARWTQMSRENLNKTLSRWSTAGLISQSQSQFIIHDLQRIEDIAEFGDDG